MNRYRFKVAALGLALLVSAGTGLGQYWGDHPYDERQWWNPADWGSSNWGPDLDDSSWDYNSPWNESVWYGTDPQGAAARSDSSIDTGYGSDTDIGSDWEDGGLFDDGWDMDWNDEFDYEL